MLTFPAASVDGVLTLALFLQVVSVMCWRWLCSCEKCRWCGDVGFVPVGSVNGVLTLALFL